MLNLNMAAQELFGQIYNPDADFGLRFNSSLIQKSLLGPPPAADFQELFGNPPFSISTDASTRLSLFNTAH